MKYTTLLTSIENNIGTITLNRPETLNMFDDLMADELNKALIELDASNDVRVVIINSAGRAFCAGIDVKNLLGKTPKEYYEWVTNMESVHMIITKMKTPVIASIQGVAVANGIGLVASADLAVASDKAKFGATAVKIGLYCMGPALPLEKCLGRKKAFELVSTGDIINAGEAKSIGLINKVVAHDDLEKETRKLANKIASYSPLAVQMGKESFYKSVDIEYAKGFEIANQYFAQLCTTHDAQEGIQAFLEKREAKWQLK